MSKINNQTIKSVSRIIDKLLTGAEITQMFNELNFPDYDQIKQRPYTSTKWIRLNESITQMCVLNKSAKPLFRVISYVMQPAHFLNDPTSWESNKKNLNAILMFHGFEVNDSGKVVETKIVETFTDAQKRLQSFNEKLNAYEIHDEIFKYCTPELFKENYFHAIFEASKGVLDRVRLLANSNLDGNELINKTFHLNNPIILIKDNMLKTNNDKSEYNGLKSLLKTIVYLYRNPNAHNPKLYDITSETDAITAFTLMSLAHKTLDRCINIRDV